MKIIAFGATHSKKSINKQFATYATTQFPEASVEVLDLNDFELPLFTVDLEKEKGYPEAAKVFLSKLDEAGLIIISLAEHNGSYTAGFKNLFDWASRIKVKLFEDKKLLLLATSPGAGGAQSVLEAAKTRFPRHGAKLVGAFSLPNFKDNFSPEKGIVNDALRKDFLGVIDTIK